MDTKEPLCSSPVPSSQDYPDFPIIKRDRLNLRSILLVILVCVVATGSYLADFRSVASVKALNDRFSQCHYVPNATPKDMAMRCRDSKNDVVLMVANFGFLDLTMNALCSLHKVGLRSVIIAALDQDMLAYCQDKNLPCYKAYSDENTFASQAADYASENYRTMVFQKSAEELNMLKSGVNVLFIDGDIFVMRNPLPLLNAMANELQLDVLFQTDTRHDIAGFHGINSGFLYLRSSGKVVEAVESVVQDRLRTDHGLYEMEQARYNRVLCDIGGMNDWSNATVSERLCINQDGVRSMALPLAFFPNGREADWDALQWPQKPLPSKPFMIHANWMVGGGNKWQRLADSGLVAFDTSSKECMH